MVLKLPSVCLFVIERNIEEKLDGAITRFGGASAMLNSYIIRDIEPNFIPQCMTRKRQLNVNLRKDTD